ncbi:hypothetical protein JOD43_001649 [Pullulanibacillus pueri]|uniref:YpfB family protein n=1 Tax=Pullulanibacillus pueri TaxID=1437324 RepID=A0A8J2ZUT9_9BACL|nr:YpfB family protein [Pullulanibacillus pueri]MBM7681482.1 hypothetical protein [Pullulanibacillus pueri]GGH79056.1 hypothetical protein GCM10007096_13420 [Pullulanibacillus pueri]
MRSDLPKTVEKWLVRLVIIQFIALIMAQFMMKHHTLSPYLNKAVRYEGVFEPKESKTLDTIQQSPYMWYDENKKFKE